MVSPLSMPHVNVALAYIEVVLYRLYAVCSAAWGGETNPTLPRLASAWPCACTVSTRPDDFATLNFPSDRRPDARGNCLGLGSPRHALPSAIFALPYQTTSRTLAHLDIL